MCEHEHKNCPRCNATFECKVGSILLCQCTAVRLNDTERDYMKSKFDDCLCAKCMKDVKGEYHNNLFKTKFKRLFGIDYK